METKPEATEGLVGMPAPLSRFGETTNTDSEVSISILKHLKLKKSCIIHIILPSYCIPARKTVHRTDPNFLTHYNVCTYVH